MTKFTEKRFGKLEMVRRGDSNDGLSLDIDSRVRGLAGGIPDRGFHLYNFI